MEQVFAEKRPDDAKEVANSEDYSIGKAAVFSEPCIDNQKQWIVTDDNRESEKETLCDDQTVDVEGEGCSDQCDDAEKPADPDKVYS